MNRIVAIAALLLVTPVRSESVRIACADPVGPEVKWFGWDLKGWNNLTHRESHVDLLFTDTGANLVRIPILAHAHSEDGEINEAAYATMLKSLKNILRVDREVKVFASLKLLGADTFPEWIETREKGHIFNKPAKKPDAEKYARLVAEYLKFLADERIGVDFLGPCNEVCGVLTPEVFADFIEQLPTAMDEVRVPSTMQEFQVIAPESFGLNTALRYARELDDLRVDDEYDIVGSHFYAHLESGKEEDWAELKKLTRKPMWHTEVHFVEKGDLLKKICDSTALLFATNKQGVEGFVWWGPGANDTPAHTIKRQLTASMLGAQLVKTSPGFNAKGNPEGEPVFQAIRAGDTVTLWAFCPGKTWDGPLSIKCKGADVRNAQGYCWIFGQGGEADEKPLRVSSEGFGELAVEEFPGRSVAMIRIKLR